MTVATTHTFGAVCLVTACMTLGCRTPLSPLDVSPNRPDLQQNPKLLGRIQSSPHGYFRFINKPFSEAICREISRVLDKAPLVNLHGDAHLEQYAVTDLGRGLTDFDDAAVGPAPLDLVRFGVSIALATEARGWSSSTTALLTRFLAGYRAALRDPETEAPMPKVAKRVRDGFKSDRTTYLAWVESVSEPMSADERSALESALKPYVATMKTQSPDLPGDFFRVIDTRRLTLGIGSALDDKFVVRVDGATPAPTDDVILEVKEVRDLSGVSCVSSSAAQDPFRILVAQSRIAYRPYRFLGYIRFGEQTFWIHAWVDNYKELKLGKTITSPEELAEVVYDVGVQLGRGHPSQIAAPLDLQLRQALLALVDQHESDFYQAVSTLCRDVQSAWARFTKP